MLTSHLDARVKNNIPSWDGNQQYIVTPEYKIKNITIVPQKCTITLIHILYMKLYFQFIFTSLMKNTTQIVYINILWF